MYIWPAKKKKVANALVSGFRQKNIFISDYLIENVTPEELETILAHEIGHIKRFHLWIRTFVTLLPLPIFIWIGKLMDYYQKISQRNIPEIPGMVGILGLFILYYAWVFRYITRIQERQADGYVLQLNVDPNVYISALLKLAKLNHLTVKINKLDEKFQTHPSFARRIRWIEENTGINC